MRLTASHTPFTSPPVITPTSIVRGLLVIPTLSYTLLKHKFPTVPHCERCMIINVEAEVQRCHFVVSDWCSTAVILQLPCESARLFVSTLQSGDNFEKYSISLSHRFWVQADEYVRPRRIFFSYQPLKVDIGEMLQNSFFSQVFPAIQLLEHPAKHENYTVRTPPCQQNTGVFNSEIEFALTCL